MSKNNSYVNQDLSEEEKIAVLLIIDDIYKLEQKIKALNEELNIINKNYSEDKIRDLNNKKNNYLREINNNKNKLSLYLSNNNIQINSKTNELNNIDEKINELKIIIFSYSQMLFNQNDINNNNNSNILLPDNDIFEIFKKRENSKINYIKNKINNEKKVYEENIIHKNQIICKINEIDENIKMIKEEKITIKNELVNNISYKETLESVIKSNIQSILINVNRNNNYVKENNSILFDNSWNEILNLFSYEFNYINPIKFSVGMTNDIFYLLESNVKSSISNNKKEQDCILNTNRSSLSINSTSNLNINFKSDNKSLYMNKSNNKDNINIFNLNQRYSLQNLLQIEMNDILKKLKNNEIIINDWIKNIANKLILKINEFGYNEKNIYLNLNNLMIYISFYLKKMYYESIISIKIKFINKDYKTMKKEFNKMKIFLIQDLKNCEENINNIKNKIISFENEITKISEKNSSEKEMNLINLTDDEKKYIKIINNINLLKEKKNTILKNIENYENDNNIITQEINLKINQLLTGINEIDDEINEINNYLKSNKEEINKEILECKQKISEKCNNIKEQIQRYKIKYKNNLKEYNIFINNLKNVIKNKYFKTLINFDNVFSSIETDISNQNNIMSNTVKYKVICGDLLSSSSFKELSVKNKKISIENSIILNNELENSSINIMNNDNDNDNNYENNSNYSDISLINYNTIKNNKFKEIKLINENISNFSSIKNDHEINYNTRLSSSRIPYPCSKINSFLDNIKIKTNYKNQRNNKKNIFINSSSIENLKQTKATNISLNNTNISENPINYNTKYIFRNDKKAFKKSRSCLSLQNNFAFNKIDFFKKKYKNKDMTNQKNYDCNFSYFNKQKNISNYKSFVSDIFFNKSNPLLKKTFCYYREKIHPNHKKFNPIKDNPLLLPNYPYNYIKSTISVCNNYDNIKVVPSSQLDNIIYSLKIISNIEINSMTKIIIEINKNYRRYKYLNKNWIKNEFISKQKKNYLIFDENEIEKCFYNKYYNFFVVLLNNKKIEFLFSSYEEFKLWFNGINFIIKNKNEIIQLIESRKKFIN